MTRTGSVGFLDLPGNQYWEFTKRLYDFSSHTFEVLSPEKTIRFANAGINLGMMNSCAEGTSTLNWTLLQFWNPVRATKPTIASRM